MLPPFTVLKNRLLTNKNAKALRRNLARRGWRNISSIRFLIANQHCQALSANSQLVLRHWVFNITVHTLYCEVDMTNHNHRNILFVDQSTAE